MQQPNYGYGYQEQSYTQYQDQWQGQPQSHYSNPGRGRGGARHFKKEYGGNSYNNTRRYNTLDSANQGYNSNRRPYNAEEAQAELAIELKRMFEKENLMTNTYLLSSMDYNLCLSVGTVFRSVKYITRDYNLFFETLKNTEGIIVSDTDNTIRVNIKNERNTVILQDLPSNFTELDVSHLLETQNFTPLVKNIQKDILNSFLVTFDSEDSAIKAAEWLREHKINDKAIQVSIKSENVISTLQALIQNAQYYNSYNDQYNSYYYGSGYYSGNYYSNYYNGQSYQQPYSEQTTEQPSEQIESYAEGVNQQQTRGYYQGGYRGGRGRGGYRGSRGGGNTNFTANVTVHNDNFGPKRKKSGGYYKKDQDEEISPSQIYGHLSQTTRPRVNSENFPPLPTQGQSVTPGYQEEYKAYGSDEIIKIFKGLSVSDDMPEQLKKLKEAEGYTILLTAHAINTLEDQNQSQQRTDDDYEDLFPKKTTVLTGKTPSRSRAQSMNEPNPKSTGKKHVHFKENDGLSPEGKIQTRGPSKSVSSLAEAIEEVKFN